VRATDDAPPQVRGRGRGQRTPERYWGALDSHHLPPSRTASLPEQGATKGQEPTPRAACNRTPLPATQAAR